MSVREQYSGDQFPQVLAGTTGSASVLLYKSTGSALMYSVGAGTANSKDFIGIAVDNFIKGSYVAVQCEGVVQLTKHASSNKIELGDRIYGSKTTENVGTLAGGTCIGVCAKQSSTSDSYVAVKLLPFYYSPGA